MADEPLTSGLITGNSGLWGGAPGLSNNFGLWTPPNGLLANSGTQETFLLTTESLNQITTESSQDITTG